MVETKVFSKSRIIASIMFAMLLLFSGVLFACGDPTKNINVTVDSQLVEIYLGETEANTATVYATLTNASDSQAKNLHIATDNNNITVLSKTYVGAGVTEVKIKGNIAGDSNVVVTWSEKTNKNTSFQVKVIQPVTSLIAKSSNLKHYVIKGGSLVLNKNSLVQFLPTNTKQTNVKMEIVSDNQGDKIRIQDGTLFVNDDISSSVKTVTVQVSSLDRNINPVLINFDILESFSEDSILLSGETNNISDLKTISGIHLAHNDENLSSEIVRIKVPASDKKIIFTPYITNQNLAKILQTQQRTEDGFEIFDVLVKAGQNIGDDSYLYFEISYEGYAYKFSTESFKTRIYSYDVIQDIYINNELSIPKDTDPNTQGVQLSYDLYTNYPTNINGLELKFETYPTTVAAKYKSFYIETSDYVPGAQTNKYNLFVKSGTSITPLLKNSEDKYKIEQNQSLVVRAVSGAGFTHANLRVISVFTQDFYQGTTFEKTIDIEFNIREGVNQVDFYGLNNQNVKFYLDSSYVDTQRVYFTVKPVGADILTTNFAFEGNFNVLPNTLQSNSLADEYAEGSQTLVGKGYSFDIVSKGDMQNLNGWFRISFGNGQYKIANVETLVPFQSENLHISTPTINESQSVGYYSRIPVEEDITTADFYTAMFVGSSIPFNVNAQGANITKSFSYITAEVGSVNYLNFENLDISAFASNEFLPSSTVLRSVDLNAFSLLSGQKIGKVLVRAVFEGRNFTQSSNGLYDIISSENEIITKYFYIEVYNPIRTYQSDKASVTLYAYDSVGYYNSALSTAFVNIKINSATTDATYDDIEVQPVGLGDRLGYNEMGGQKGLYRLFANSTDISSTPEAEKSDIYSDGYINFITYEFGRRYVTSVKIIIVRATKVQGIVLNNVNEQEGIKLDVIDNKTIIIDASPSNTNALNKNFKYFFEANVGTSSNVVQIDNDRGFISTTGAIGGTGSIIIVPQDLYVNFDSNTHFDPLGVVKRISIVIADGRSRETSYSVNSLDEVTDFTSHYTLTQNVVYPTNVDSAFVQKAQTTVFNGGLYGRSLYGNGTTYTIKFGEIGTNYSLFNEIGSSALLEDLVLAGRIEGSSKGFVANINNGTISNVIVDTLTENNVYSMSYLNSSAAEVGGLVGLNSATGVIKNSSFYGSVTGDNYVGGLVGNNQGKIQNSKVEFYSYENSQKAKLEATNQLESRYVGGIAGKSSTLAQATTSTALIENTYAYSYHREDVLIGDYIGGLVGFINGASYVTSDLTIGAVIKTSFAKTNANQFVGNRTNPTDNETYSEGSYEANYNISNSYLFAYKTAPTYSEKYMVINPQRKLLLNARSVYHSDFVSYYSGYGINFNQASVWAVSNNFNNGYPYIKANYQENAPTNLNSLSLKNLSNVLVNGQHALFFMHEKIDTVTLTQNETSTIRNWNTINFNTLFGISNTAGLRVIASRSGGVTNITTLSNSIQLTSIGESITLTVFSKYDYSIRKDYIVAVYYAISDFKVIFQGEVLENDSVIGIKSGTSEVFVSSFQTSKVVTNRNIEFKQNPNMLVRITTPTEGDFVTASSNFVHSINTSNFPSNFVNFTAFPSIKNANDYYTPYVTDLLREHYGKRFTVSRYYGAESIDANISEIIRIMPSDTVEFTAQMTTDAVDENLKVIITDINGNRELSPGVTYNSMFDNGSYQNYTDGELMAVKIPNATVVNGIKYTYFYKVRLNIAQDYKDYNFAGMQLIITLQSEEINSVKKEISLIIDSQVIESIFVTSHEFEAPWSETKGYGFKSEPNNVISPGRSSLLKINLFPEFAYYQSLQITSSSSDGNSVILNLMKEHPSEANRYLRLTSGFTAITNGISVTKQQLKAINQEEGNTQKNLQMIYLYATIPSTVKIDTVFTITIRAFDGNGTQINTPTTYTLITRPLVAANIQIEGEDNLLMARGTEAEVVVTVQADQTVTSIIPIPSSATGNMTGISLGAWVETLDQVANKRTYKLKVYVSEVATFTNSASPEFFINATVSRRIGDFYEQTTTSVKVTVVDFLIKENTFKIDSLLSEQNILDTYVGIGRSVNFNFDTTEWKDYGQQYPELALAVKQLKEKVEYFKAHNYLYNVDPVGSNSKYILNYHTGDTSAEIYKNYLNNLYYVNSNGTTTKVLNSSGLTPNNIIKFDYSEVSGGISSTTESGKLLNVIGLREGSQNLRLVFKYQTPSGEKEFSYDFTIRVLIYTEEADKPLQITNEDDFIEMQYQETPQNYILMNDLELSNYVPFDTSKIASLDGNNKVITIRNFDLTANPNSSTLSLALFTNVSANTSIKNVTVNYYHINNMVIDTVARKTIQYAGFAINNYGIITNTQVVSFLTNSNLVLPTSSTGLKLNYSIGLITNNISSTIAGFVINNNATGTITNSRVGGTEINIVNSTSIRTGIHNLGILTLSGQGNISGFVNNNIGTISSSFTNKINIINNTTSGRETITTGFVGNNSGNISLSYSKGAYSTITPNEIKATGSGIATSSVGSGFVYDNGGRITDSYSNIMIKDIAGVSGRNGAGFVYINRGLIEKAYSASTIENSLTTQMNFNGVDDYGNLLNSGTIRNSYFYSPSSESQQNGDLETLYNSGVLRIDSFSNSDVFYGFSFATINSLDGVWVMTSSKGPDLVSANEIAVSSRYLVENVDGSIMLPYLNGYQYGSDKNPIIIRTAKEYNEVFGLSTTNPIKDYFNTTQKTVFGNYRLVSNINLSQLSSSENESYRLVSSEMRLTNNAVFDGNGLKISNLELVSSVDFERNYYGMFASIENNSIIKNLFVELVGVNASNVQNVGAIAGILSDSKIVNITLSSQNISQTALVLGQNVVGGIVGVAKGSSALVGLSATNISVTADYFNDSGIQRQRYIRQSAISAIDNQTLSYAGGIVGILDLYSLETFANPDYAPDNVLSFSSASALHVDGLTQIRGGTVGGVIAYLGINSSVRDATYEITQLSSQYTQKLISYKYAAGGIIGESYGNVTQSKIEHSYNAQMIIEANISNHYKTSQEIQRGHESLFYDSEADYEPIFVGGLIGQIFSGKISNSYAKVNVLMPTIQNSTNTDNQFVGGIFGGMGDFEYSSNDTRNISIINVEEVYSFGDIRAKLERNNIKSAAGGVAGFIEHVKPETINFFEQDITFTFDGVNAVTYLNRNWTSNEYSENQTTRTLNYVYDFYAYTQDLQGNFLESTNFYTYITTEPTIENPYNLVVITRSEDDEDSKAPYNFVIDSFVSNGFTYKPKVSNVGRNNLNQPKVFYKMVQLDKIVNVAQDSSFMDIIFRNNNWSSDLWERKSNELLPRIVFTVSTSIIIIEDANDFYLMQKEGNNDKTFIIRGNTAPDINNQVLIDMSSIVDGTLNIQEFRGVLKGETSSDELGSAPRYGIKNLNISNALIKSATNGAIFSDFIIENSNMTSATQGSALLVNSANGTIFRNLVVKNVSVTTNSTVAAVLAGVATNSLFDTIYIQQSVARNLVVQNITKEVFDTVYPVAQRQTNQITYSAGIVAGKVFTDRKTTFKDIVIDMRAGQEQYGVRVNGTIRDDEQPENTIKYVNIGGLFGLATGITEFILSNQMTLSETGVDNIMTNMALSFSDNVMLDENDNLVPDYYSVKVGALGGSASNFNFRLPNNEEKIIQSKIALEGQFYDPIASTSVAISAGGLIGYSNSLNVSTELTGTVSTKKSKALPTISIKNNYEGDSTPNIYVGGIAGSVVGGTVYVENYAVENKIARYNYELSGSTEVTTGNTINIESTNNYLYVGGLIGQTSARTNITNTIVNTRFNANIDNQGDMGSVYFGGILAYYINNSDYEVISTLINNTFNGRLYSDNIQNVVAGGILGSIPFMESNYTNSSITLNQNNFGGVFEIIKPISSSVISGGILGNAYENADSADSTLLIYVRNNIAFGDINITTETTSDNEDLILGGIVGQGSPSLYVSLNNSLTTLYTTRVVNSGINMISAIVGDQIFGKSDSSATINNSYSNNYVSQINLATDKYQIISDAVNNEDKIFFANNISYRDMLDKLSQTTKLTPLLDAISISNTNNIGYKLNPKVVTSQSDLTILGNSINRSYLRVGGSFVYTASSITLSMGGNTNWGIVGDGYQINVNNAENRIFNLIDNQTFVSGFSINLQKNIYPTIYNTSNEYEYVITTENTQRYPFTIYGGLSAVNEGVVFGSSVAGVKSVGLNNQIDKSYTDLLNRQLVLSGADLVGGLVGYNKGYIADSITSLNITNISKARTVSFANSPSINFLPNNFFELISGNNYKITPITGGFVGLNEGDISSSYSTGSISASYSNAYAFGADNKNVKYGYSSLNGTPTVKQSYTTTMIVDALKTLNEAGTQIAYSAYVFGYAADNSNYYDIFATQVSEKLNTNVIKYKTQQMSVVDSNSSTLTVNPGTEKFVFNPIYNYGYASFGGAYSNSAFEFMKQQTQSVLGLVTNVVVPNLGKLQQYSNILPNLTGNNRYNIFFNQDMKITKDMLYVGTSEIIDLNSNWENFAIVNTNIYGNGKSISNFVVTADEASQKYSTGFFTSMRNSTIQDLYLYDGKVESKVLSTNENLVYVGAFAGTMSNNSKIINSYNMGVNVHASNYGYAGGIVGLIRNSEISQTTNAANVVSRAKELMEETYMAYAGGIAGRIQDLIQSSSSSIKNNVNLGLVYAGSSETKFVSNASNVVAAGIVYNTSITLNEGNNNYGDVRAVSPNSGREVITSLGFNLFNSNVKDNVGQDSVLPFDSAINYTNTPLIGSNTKLQPYVINTFDELKSVIGYYNGGTLQEMNILLMSNINLGVNLNNSVIGYFDMDNPKEFIGSINGNNKLLTYISSSTVKDERFNDKDYYSSSGIELDLYDNNYLSFIYMINENSTIENLKILGINRYVYNSSAILAVVNNGKISYSSTYGVVKGYDFKVNIDAKSYVAGTVVNNNGEIIGTNNFALVKGVDGIDATDELTDGKPSNNIGGIAGFTYNIILYSNNNGALVGGSGGNGYSYSGTNATAQHGTHANSFLGTQSTKGTDGKSGTHGGNASIIGGIASYIYGDSEQPYLVTGSNNGILIGGRGGLGGNGQNGGNGGNSDIAVNAGYVYTQMVVTAIGGYIFLFASATAAWSWGASFAVYGIYQVAAGLFYNEVLMPVINNYGGSDAGVGGAGGNGGNSLYSDVAGISKISTITKINSTSIITEGSAGIGGRGGDGGNGGTGMLYPRNLFDAARNVVTYGKAGNGGGAGGTGYNGNSFETVRNITNYYDNFSLESMIVASKGGKYNSNGILTDVTSGGDGAIKGGNGISSSSMGKEANLLILILLEDFIDGSGSSYMGYTDLGSGSGSLINIGGIQQSTPPEFKDTVVSYLEEQIATGGKGKANTLEQLQTDGKVGYYLTDLQTDTQGNILITSWNDLKYAMLMNDNSDTKLVLQNDFVFGREAIDNEIFVSELYNTLKGFKGTLTSGYLNYDFDNNGVFNQSDWYDRNRDGEINIQDYDFNNDGVVNVYDFDRNGDNNVNSEDKFKIIIEGSYSDLELFENIKAETKFADLNIELNITDFDNSYISDKQFISKLTEENEEFYDDAFVNVKFYGSIQTNYTKEMYKLVYPDSAGTDLSDLSWNFNPTSIVHNVVSGKFEINSQEAFDEFIELANAGSTQTFVLKTDVSIEPQQANSYAIPLFKGTLEGSQSNPPKINLLQKINENESVYTFSSFIRSNEGQIKDIIFKGLFNNSAVAYENQGTINRVTVGEVGDYIISSGMLAGISIENHGTISVATNNIALTSQTSAVAGITIFNYGLLNYVGNVGNLIAGNGNDAEKYRDINDVEQIRDATSGGDAAGIAIYNYGRVLDGSVVTKGITRAMNLGNVTAGNGGSGRDSNGDLISNNGSGGNAAGLIVYNFEVSVVEGEIYYYGGIIESLEGTSISYNSGIITSGNATGEYIDISAPAGKVGQIVAIFMDDFAASSGATIVNAEQFINVFESRGNAISGVNREGVSQSTTVLPDGKEVNP